MAWTAPHVARFALVLPLMLLLAAGCSMTAVEDEITLDPAPRSLSESERSLVRADNQFGLHLFRSISARAPGENAFVSPLSVSMALGMALNGADGDTRTAMETTLALSGLSSEAINTAYRDLITLLEGLDPEVTLALANSIWYREDFAVEPAFIETNQTYFDAAVRALNFSRPDALGTINGWVKTNTRGKIEKILDRIGSDEVMFLINALYFKGAWTYAFDEERTADAPFTQHDGSTTAVPMMHQTTDLPYFETEALQAVDVPYSDSLFSMTVLLPRAGHDVEDVVARLDTTQWADWTARFEPRRVDLRLPRFTLAYEKTLNETLAALGMGVAFDCTAANFAGINPDEDLCISRVKHKTFVAVNEAGTEAAAVTSVGIRVTSAPVATDVHVNRPFALVIRERHSGTILFAGKVNAL